ncbi:MAG: VCBS repeat-containing protein [Candidatus Hydrogenedens sp.]|nr:VCBS repeat-containing protein [Candidatus Hydrogenedens sp.]
MSTAILLLLASAAADDAPLKWERVKISDATYEAASVFDVDKDGHLDIMSGEYWYSGPEFTERHKVADIRMEGDYYDDFSNNPMDVNGDGYLDVVTGGWFGESFQWRENPKGGMGEWTTHTVAKTGNIERNVFHDIDGDGTEEVFATTNPVHFFKLNQEKGEFDQFTIENALGGHGFGVGDVDGDGHDDLLFATGWMKGPEDPYNVTGYQKFETWNLGMASVPILLHDVDGDGDMDVVYGQGHAYGLFWLERNGDPTLAESWTRRDIEPKRSQFHDVQLADLDNDGKLELVTGKRFRAHMGKDPGAADPLGVYVYTNNGGSFERMTLDYGEAGQASGVGIYFWIEDVDGNGWKDIVCPGKDGLYLFKNLGK